MTEEGVVVEIQFGIQGHHIAALGDRQGIDLHLRAVLFQKEAVHGVDEPTRGPQPSGGKPQKDAGLSRLIGLQPESGVDLFAEDGGGILFRDSFDLHATFPTGDEDRAISHTVQGNREVKFPGDFRRFPHQNGMDRLPLGSGLMGDQLIANHARGDIADLGGGFDEMDPRFESVLECALPAASRVDLGLDDKAVAGKRTGNGFRFFRRASHGPAGNRHPGRGQKVACLVFVNVHEVEKLMTASVLERGNRVNLEPELRGGELYSCAGGSGNSSGAANGEKSGAPVLEPTFMLKGESSLEEKPVKSRSVLLISLISGTF